MNKKPLLIIGAVIIGVLLLCGLCSIGIYAFFAVSSVATEDADIGEFYEEEYFGPGLEESPDTGTCDNATDDFLTLYRTEGMKVIENPCDVIWLLAQEEESYTLQSLNGTTIYVTVWRDYVDNVTPGDTFTVRAMDVPDDAFNPDGPQGASILIVNWVTDENDLADAKSEVRDFVNNLDY